MLVRAGAWIDWAFSWIKWPAAIVAVGLLPPALIAFFELLSRIATGPRTMLLFLLGFATYLILWWNLFRKSRFTLFLTLEHELTHVLFALLTLHPVTDIRVTAWHGGRMEMKGRGNWLISLAPYFFPTASLALIFLMWIGSMILPPALQLVGEFLVGSSFAYHVTSTLRETHRGQTDLQTTGFLFSLLVLPIANVISCGIVLAFCHAGFAGVGEFLGGLGRATTEFWYWPT